MSSTSLEQCNIHANPLHVLYQLGIIHANLLHVLYKFGFIHSNSAPRPLPIGYY